MLDVFLVLFGLLALVGAVGTISARHPIHSAMALVLTFLSVASIYALLGAHLLAAIQVIVYVGAIMVLIVYTILLLDIRETDLAEGKSLARVVGAVLGVVWAVALAARAADLPVLDAGPVPADFGTVESIARELFTKHLYTFELISVLLLAAIVGALVLAQRRNESPAQSEQTP